MILEKDIFLDYVFFPNGLDFFQLNDYSVDLRIDTVAEVLTLDPGATAILQTLDKVGLAGTVMGIVYPRSSTNRRGLMVHMTGVVDPGYEGTLTVPVTNLSKVSVSLLRGERIASIVFHSTSNTDKKKVPRPSRYANSDGEFLPDKEEERAFLAANDLQGLKDKYRL